jgi:Holliday junction resolvase
MSGTNPGRKNEAQSYHDKILKLIANNLDSQGYYVLADHIGWKNGSPTEINGYIPDIVATKNNSTIVLEVEDCTSYGSTHTKEQLKAFSKNYKTYVIIPKTCYRDGKAFSPVSDMKSLLTLWKLENVTVGTCDPSTGEIKYSV